MAETKLICLDPPAGTRDFLPRDMRIRNWLFDIWKDVSRKNGFEEYDCSIVENSSLYTRKGGDDIINEMFAFTLGNISLALRPEMTPSLARLMMKNIDTEPWPFKWFSIPQCWRYEDIKRGRKREHYQWNADIFGAPKIISEIEIFMMIITFFQRIGLTSDNVVLKISNRMILQKVLNKMNVDDNLFERACVIIDKMAKVTREEMSEKLRTEISLTNSQIDTIYELCKICDVSQLSRFLDETDETYLEMKQIFELAEKLKIRQWLQFDASIVRGLSYYSALVFEGFAKNMPNLQKSICGGGRYDNLLTKYGYKGTVPAVGFGFGDVVIIELLRDMGKLPECPIDTKYIVVPYDYNFIVDAINVSQMIRAKGVCVATYTKLTKVAKAYDYANRKGIDTVILIAPNEWAQNKIVVKKLREDKNSTTKQMTMLLSDFITNL